MLVLDSSVWIEYFSVTCKHKEFIAAIDDVENLIVPAITIYEVFKRMLAQKTQDDALDAVRVMISADIVPLDDLIAVRAAKFSHEHKIPMADSIIYVSAQKNNATVWTMDADLKGLPKVKYFGKK